MYSMRFLVYNEINNRNETFNWMNTKIQTLRDKLGERKEIS